MLNPREFVVAIREAYDRTRERSHDLTGNPLAVAEELQAQLIARGLVVVEIPAGTRADYAGIPAQVLE